MIFKYLHLPKFLYLCIVTICLIAAILIALYLKFTPAHKEDEYELPIPVMEDSFSNTLVLLGKIEPYRIITLYAPFEGTVQSLTVNNGDRVKMNDHLLTLDKRKLDVQLREALTDKLRAQKSVQELIHWNTSPEMLTAQRNIAQLKRTLSRIHSQEDASIKLFEKGIIPRQELDDITLQRQTLETELKAAQEDHHQLSTQAQGEVREIAEMTLLNAIEKYDELLKLRAKQKITAPINGTVIFTAKPSQTTDRPTTIDAGVHVSAGQMLLQLASSENFKITSFVSEHDLHQIKTGQIVTVTGDGLNQHTLHGSIENINEHAEPNDDITEPASFAITVTLNDIPATIRPYIRSGMLVTITIIT